MAVRGLLALALAGAVVDDSRWLFPAALGCLVASKAYGVTRAAAVPRLLPDGVTLVKANARVSLAGILGATVSAPLAVLASYFGPEWSLRYAFVLFVVATIWAIRLPAQVDSSVGEGVMSMRSGPGSDAEPSRPERPRIRIPGTVSFALRANCGPRWLSGFLTMFLAFLLRENPIGDYRPELLLALVIGGVGLGSTPRHRPRLGDAEDQPGPDRRPGPGRRRRHGPVRGRSSTACSRWCCWGSPPDCAQSLAKLALDSTIQRDVPERVHASAFARSDTTLQLAWVIGGFVGIAMPLMPRTGLSVAVAVLCAWLLFVIATRPQAHRPATPGPAVLAAGG